MVVFIKKTIGIFLLIGLLGCKKEAEPKPVEPTSIENTVEYASGLSIKKYHNYSIVHVSNPWPNATKTFTYVLKNQNTILPDSLQNKLVINVPLKSIVATSTTVLPFLEMLGVQNKLVGFPNTDYVSSPKTRALIDQGLVKNIGQNESLNIEQLIELSPNLIVAFGIDNNNPMIDNLEKSGLKILIQADWMEETPLGKAEWIKLYGALFGKEKEAKKCFEAIKKNYKDALALVQNKTIHSTVLYGSMYQDQWYLAKGSSFVAQFIKDAKADYLWSDLEGSGSLGVSFESVLEKGKNANYWIATVPFTSLAELNKATPHYSQFEAFKNKNIYSFETQKGATGGVIYYELAPSRPDLVLKDYIKIFHPNLLPTYSLTFARKLK